MPSDRCSALERYDSVLWRLVPGVIPPYSLPSNVKGLRLRAARAPFKLGPMSKNGTWQGQASSAAAMDQYIYAKGD